MRRLAPCLSAGARSGRGRQRRSLPGPDDSPRTLWRLCDQRQVGSRDAPRIAAGATRCTPDGSEHARSRRVQLNPAGSSPPTGTRGPHASRVGYGFRSCPGSRESTARRIPVLPRQTGERRRTRCRGGDPGHKRMIRASVLSPRSDDKAGDTGQDFISRLGPHEGLRRFVVDGQVAIDGHLEIACCGGRHVGVASP